MVHFQSLPDEVDKYVMHYENHLSKYNLLQPLKTKWAAEVAYNLLQIFIDFGAPVILQSDNGQEFTAQVIEVFFGIIL